MENIIINHPELGEVKLSEIEIHPGYISPWACSPFTVQALIDKIKEQHLEIQVLKNKQQLTNNNYIMKEFNIEQYLGKKNDDIGFANGGGYIQHSISTVERARTEFHLFATTWLNNRAIEYINSSDWLKFHDISHRPKAIQEAQSKTYDRIFIGRWLDDSNSPLYSAWSRLYCIDEQGREWGQPYYAANPTKGNQIQLNHSI